MVHGQRKIILKTLTCINCNGKIKAGSFLTKKSAYEEENKNEMGKARTFSTSVIERLGVGLITNESLLGK